jgi:hypothetical protein
MRFLIKKKIDEKKQYVHRYRYYYNSAYYRRVVKTPPTPPHPFTVLVLLTMKIRSDFYDDANAAFHTSSTLENAYYLVLCTEALTWAFREWDSGCEGNEGDLDLEVSSWIDDNIPFIPDLATVAAAAAEAGRARAICFSGMRLFRTGLREVGPSLSIVRHPTETTKIPLPLAAAVLLDKYLNLGTAVPEGNDRTIRAIARATTWAAKEAELNV